MTSRNAVAEFNYYLDRATSPKEIESHYYFAVNKVCWMIDELIIKPDDAINAIHGKIVDDNPEIVLCALKVLNAVFYKCGSKVSNVICTEFYMDLLKGIIQTTDNIDIKKTILHMLHEWAENFKYFPQYSAPQKLLQELNVNEIPKPNKCENKDTNRVSTNNESDNNNQSNAEFQEREDFKKALKEYQQKRKIDYNNYRKKEGLPPLSSDEEDHDDKKGIKKCPAEKEKAWRQVKSTLTKELQQNKQQRLRLDNSVLQLRIHKHEDYVLSNNGASMEMQQCKDVNCKSCKKIESKDDTEESVPKRLPYEIRKIVESKQRINQNIEDIRRLKKDAHYKNKPLSSLSNNHKKMDLDLSRDSELEENEQLKEAILLSERMAKSISAEPKQTSDTIQNSPLFGEIEAKFDEKVADRRLHPEARNVNTMTTNQMQRSDSIESSATFEETDEVKILKEVLAASRLDAEVDNFDENLLLQQAINKSFTEEEEKNFSSMPKVSEKDLIEYAKKMSLEESSKSNNEELTSDGKGLDCCIVCYDLKILKQFMPCEHKCICKECAAKYVSHRCPLCNKYYTSIIDLKNYIF